MRQRNKIPQALGASFAMGALILDNHFAITTASEAVQFSLQTVIPALFPFFVLSSIVASSTGKLPQFILRLFNISPESGTILLTGLLGGFPVGAKNISEAYADGRISKSEAERLLPICSQCGPAFIFGLTIHLFKDVKICLLLWGIQIICVLLMCRLIPVAESNILQQTKLTSITWSDAVQRGIRAMASVCGWIILFHLLIGFLNRWFFWRVPLPFRISLAGLLELTNGCNALQKIDNQNIQFLLCVIMVSFGGVCVTMQSFSVLHSDLKRFSYFPGKLLQTALGILFASAVQQKLYTVTWIAMAISPGCVYFFRKRKKAVAIQQRMLYNSDIKDTRKLLCSLEKR